MMNGENRIHGNCMQPSSETTIDDLPNDVVSSIFSRFTLEDLLILQHVSERWASFAEAQAARAAHEPAVLAVDMKKGGCTVVKRLSMDMKRIEWCAEFKHPTPPPQSSGAYVLQGSCKGLLCMVRRSNASALVLNPFAEEDKALELPPAPTMSFDTLLDAYGLGAAASSGVFKLVRVFHQTLELGAEVYVLGTSAWRTLPRVPLHTLPLGPPVFIDGVIYWVHKELDEFGYVREDSIKRITCFDVGKEEFESMDLATTRVRDFELVDLRGRLALVELLHTHIAIRVLEGHSAKGGTWSLWPKITVHIPGLSIRVLGSISESEILVNLRSSQFLTYGPEGWGRNLSVADSKAKILCHVPSLISVSKFRVI